MFTIHFGGKFPTPIFGKPPYFASFYLSVSNGKNPRSCTGDAQKVSAPSAVGASLPSNHREAPGFFGFLTLQPQEMYVTYHGKRKNFKKKNELKCVSKMHSINF